jgi:hypothetical protein
MKLKFEILKNPKNLPKSKISKILDLKFESFKMQTIFELKANTLLLLFDMWAVPGGTAIPGQPAVEQEQAPKSPP